MTKKLLLAFCLSIVLSIPSNQIVTATSQTDVIRKFKYALIQNDEKLVKSYVTKGVAIPIFKENKQIFKMIEVPSQKQDTKVLIAYFKEKHSEYKIAFILEVVSKNSKISHIKTVLKLFY
ncbi:hypothetical protein D0U04_29030 [Bacillus clarus]|uniref:Uncharacterized protein n=1 Tax=Bacillus clarus TaxID=2338372 RepID=A0A090YLQ5_9BACI|nr:hypothetical protein [Bacillus clarus]KFM98872.1 hypothetical protein DJ93_4965 [Bacillus clarus]RFT62139.1 hypothetical protein D0U04_29030 [Bacillus clarus]